MRHPLRTLAALIAMLLLAAACVPAPTGGAPHLAATPSPPAQAAVEKYLAEVRSADQFSGAVLVAKGFVPFASLAMGFADRDGSRPNSLGTAFNLASLGRVFTAAAIGRLVDQGKVGLEDPLSKYVPDYPRPAGDQITVAMLLAHTAGTGDFLTDPGYQRVRSEFTTLRELVDAVDTRVAPGSVPGKTFAYSNTGYLLLGLVIERASGRDYYTYMAEEIFGQAGIGSGFLRNTEEDHARRGYALGFRADGSTDSDVLPIVGTPAGGAYASTADLLAFHKALATGALVRTDTLRKLALRPPAGGETSAGLSSGVFAGDDVGASAVFGMTPNGHTVIVLANIPGAAQPVADRILAIVEPRR